MIRGNTESVRAEGETIVGDKPEHENKRVNREKNAVKEKLGRGNRENIARTERERREREVRRLTIQKL